jgi:hypothetical protein
MTDLPVRKSDLQVSVVAHACNPSFFGGGGRKIVNSRDPISKTKH